MRTKSELALDGEAVSVLLVGDNASDDELMRRLLEAAEGTRFDLDRVRTIECGLQRLRERAFDVCLIDSPAAGCGAGDPLDLVRAAQDLGSGPPIILLGDRGNRELDLAAMAVGAADYLDRGRVDAVQLERSIRYALARRRSADRLTYLAQFDDLTGLANRSLFQDRLERALAMARRRELLVAVFALDLNGFKAVNDGLGHVAGDRLLVQIAARLRAALRETDTVARLGGDEFAIVIENLRKPEHAALVARKLLDAVAPPLRLDDRVVAVTASVGAALYPHDGEDAAVLRRHADAAMYRAKAKGGNLCRFHNRALERHAERGALMADDLCRALAGGELELHFRPQPALHPGARPGLAALLRWRHPELGPIAAERFLSLAEDLGLTEALTDWMLDEACHRLRVWYDQGLAAGGIHLALPLLSGRQLGWSDLALKLESRCAAHRVDPAWLEIELPEPALLADAEAGGAGLARLDDTGVRLALAGYGSGPGSLRSLSLGALDTLKLATDLLRGVPEDPRRTALVGAVIGLARQLGLRVVAEGAEGESLIAFLRRRGCDAVEPPTLRLPTSAGGGLRRLAPVSGWRRRRCASANVRRLPHSDAAAAELRARPGRSGFSQAVIARPGVALRPDRARAVRALRPRARPPAPGAHRAGAPGPAAGQAPAGWLTACRTAARRRRRQPRGHDQATCWARGGRSGHRS